MRTIAFTVLALCLATAASGQQVPLVPPLPPGPPPSVPAAPPVSSVPSVPPAQAAPGEGQLHADHVRYDVKTHALDAQGNVILTVGDTQIHADHLTYAPDAQRVQAGGSVVVKAGRTVVEAPAVTFALGADVMDGSGGVRLAEAEGTLTGDAMHANLRTREVAVSGGATLVRAGADGQTVISAPRILFRAATREAEADGGVALTQRDRVAHAERLFFSETADRAELYDHVVATQSMAPAAGAAGAGASTSAPSGAAASGSPSAGQVTLACDRLTIRLAARDMEASGNVTVARGSRSATGDRAVYTERDHRMLVTGHARMMDADGSRLRADQVTISLTDDAFEGSGNVATEFRVKRNAGQSGAPRAP